MVRANSAEIAAAIASAIAATPVIAAGARWLSQQYSISWLYKRSFDPNSVVSHLVTAYHRNGMRYAWMRHIAMGPSTQQSHSLRLGPTEPPEANHDSGSVAPEPTQTELKHLVHAGIFRPCANEVWFMVDAPRHPNLLRSIMNTFVSLFSWRFG